MGNKSKVILIAEDEPFITDLYVTKLTLEGFTVVSAENGERALEEIKAQKPDLIMLDINMPIMGGMEVLKEVKSHEDTKDIPVIILTNVKERENTEKARALGADDYLVKACFTPQEVLDVVQKYIK